MRISPQELIGILKNFGDFDPSSFKDRLRAQKIIYLLQSSGVPLGYSYSWYLHGPYSRQLADDFFEGSNEDVPILEFTDPRFEMALRHTMNLVEAKETRTVELLGSLCFLALFHPDLNKREVIAELLEKKPKFGREEAESAWVSLRRNRLVSR